MMQPRVSVLITCYNAGHFLKETLDSVLAQTYADYEIIVADDGSDDNTGEIVAGYPQVRYFYKPHSGISATRNFALSKAKGELITFLDADDLWKPEKLEKQVSYLDSHPDCQLIFTLAQNFFHGNREEMTDRQRQLMDANLDNCLMTCCIRRSLYDTYGGYSEQYPYGEDTHWVTRLWAAGINMHHCIPEILYLRRIHGGNISLSHRKVERKDVLTVMADALRQARKKGSE